MYWIYNMPSALFALLTLVAVVAFALGGMLLTRRYLLRPLGFSRETNDVVGAFSLGVTALYSITLGLIAVASWQSYSAAGVLVSREASTIGVLYREFAGYPEPLRTELRQTLREYTTCVVDKVWPAQQTGQLLDEPTDMLTRLHAQLLAFHPADSGATVMHTAATRQFDELIDLRRQRADRVNEGLPLVLWIVIGLGGIVTLGIRFFVTVERVSVHATLLGLLAVVVGLLLYLIVALDRPFRGTVSVSSAPYRLTIQKVMDPLDAEAHAHPALPADSSSKP